MLLCTHLISYIQQCDQVFVMNDGCLEEQGTLKNILTSIKRSAFLSTFENELATQSFSDSDKDSINDNISSMDPDSLRISIARRVISRPKKETHSENSEALTVCLEDLLREPAKLNTYATYFQNSASPFNLFFLIVFIFLAQGSLISTDYWLSIWASRTSVLRANITNPIVYVALTFLTLNLAIFRACWFLNVSINSSNSLFMKMTNSVLQTNLSFFKCNTLGKLLQYFSIILTFI